MGKSPFAHCGRGWRHAAGLTGTDAFGCSEAPLTGSSLSQLYGPGTRMTLKPSLTLEQVTGLCGG